MNAPEGHEDLILADDEKKVEIERDQKVPHAMVFNVQKEDHTLGNILKGKLMEQPSVKFAGYRMPHPLEHRFVLRVQTTGEQEPETVVQQSVNSLRKDLSNINRLFQEEVERVRAQGGGMTDY
eukprot:Clim_evm6s195 gene=Clim_evmTU6s195